MGSYSVLRGNEVAFYCPFCHHHKQKLQINVENQNWHCWVCNQGGKKIGYLLKKLDVDRSTILKIIEVYGDLNSYSKKKEDAENIRISLPQEYISLANPPAGFNPEYKHAIHYLANRGIGIKEIVKYNIGYCKEGLYGRRIIIPSYRDDGSINYFVSRSYYPDEKMKYKNPPVSKNIVCFESQINWNEQIILCEGVFDAIAIRRNAIPLLGKFPSKQLIEKIFMSRTKKIVIALDNDAKTEALRVAEYFRKQGINVKMMYLEEKDAAEMGYRKFYEELDKSKEFGTNELLIEKIMSI